MRKIIGITLVFIAILLLLFISTGRGWTIFAPKLIELTTNTSQFDSSRFKNQDQVWISKIKIFFMTWVSKIENNPLKYNCVSVGGKWIETAQECEHPCVSKTLLFGNATEECIRGDAVWCNQHKGNFYQCESTCRNDPHPAICTYQCVQVCKFGMEKTCNAGEELKDCKLGPCCCPKGALCD